MQGTVLLRTLQILIVFDPHVSTVRYKYSRCHPPFIGEAQKNWMSFPRFPGWPMVELVFRPSLHTQVPFLDPFNTVFLHVCESHSAKCGVGTNTYEITAEAF